MSYYTKSEALDMMRRLGLPTVPKIDISGNEDQDHYAGISVRLSHKQNPYPNVWLPSIHGCRDISAANEFIEQYGSDYEYIVHKTVKPDLIGSVSRISDKNEALIIEFFNDFNREIPLARYWFSDWNGIIIPEYVGDDSFSDYAAKILCFVRKIPIKDYTAEFVFENGLPIFTDLTAVDSLHYFL